MKTKINSLFDTLGYVLRRLGTIETKLIDDVGMHTDEITSTVVRCEVDDYLGSLNDNLLGMERIFSYLMMNNSIRKDSVVQDLVHELEGLLAATEESFLKDIFFVTWLRSIAAYKNSLYRTAYQIAIELELETPADILQKILEGEKVSLESFEKIMLTQFTNVQ